MFINLLGEHPIRIVRQIHIGLAFGLAFLSPVPFFIQNLTKNHPLFDPFKNLKLRVELRLNPALV